MGRRLKTYGEPVDLATIAVSGNTDKYIIAKKSGTVAAAYFSGLDALAASDTNFITFTIVNLGQAGAGTAPVLLATAVNTTQATGGSAIAANTKRTLSLNATVANLAQVEGDRIRFRAAVTGTLANTVTHSRISMLVDANGQ